jgi:hypothetical protein
MDPKGGAVKKKRFPSNGLPARCSKRTKTWCPTLSCEYEITSGRWRGPAFNTDSTVSLSTDGSVSCPDTSTEVWWLRFVGRLLHQLF